MLYEHVEKSFNLWGDLTDHIESKFLILGNYRFLCNALWQYFSHVSLETEYNPVRVMNYIILRLLYFRCTAYIWQLEIGRQRQVMIN